jgi:hypothetical protein
MSHYVECTPGFKDRQALIEALVAVGFDRSQIEVHEEVVPLFGYQGDERAQRAHIVIRREHVGRAANDVGWERLPTERTAPGSASTMAGIASIRRYKIASSRSTPTTPSPRQQRGMGRTVQRRELERRRDRGADRWLQVG